MTEGPAGPEHTHSQPLAPQAWPPHTFTLVDVGVGVGVSVGVGVAGVRLPVALSK